MVTDSKFTNTTYSTPRFENFQEDQKLPTLKLEIEGNFARSCNNDELCELCELY